MAAPFAIGVSGTPAGLFVLLNAASGLVWAVAFGAGGYFLGDVLGPLFSSPAARVCAGALLSLIFAVAAIRCARPGRASSGRNNGPGRPS